MVKNPSQNMRPIEKKKENPGNSIKVFPVRNRNVKRWLGLIGGIFLILSSIVGVVLLSIRAWQTFQSHGRAILVTQLPLALLLLLFVLPLSILIIIWVKRHWNDGIIVYEQGFSKQRNMKTQTWLWTEVDQLDTRIHRSVFGGSEVNSRVEISIEAQYHPPLKIKNKYENMAELAQMIRNNTLPVLYQKYLPLMANKEHTIFHKNIALNQRGITYNQNHLNWLEFDAVETHRGNLTFKANNQNDAPIIIPLKQIKNLDLLLFIIHNPGIRDNLLY